MSTNDTPRHDELVVTHAPEGVVDPGLPPHQPRLGDTDPKASKRSERIVAALFGLSVLGSIGVVVAYFAFPPGESVSSIQQSNMFLGLGLAFCFAGIGFGAVHWAKSIMNDHEKVEERHPQRSSDEDRAAAVEVLKEGAADSGIARRSALKGGLITALALLPLPVALPLIGNVGADWDVSKFRHTMWRRGTRLMTDPTYRPIRAADVTIGSVVHVIPEGLHHDELESDQSFMDEKAKAVVLLVRLDERDLKHTEGSYHGIVAFSKICTHVGCPVALYEQQTHHLLCPCHQSTFDLANEAKVVFGPAKRALPQLPITVDTEGYLVARSDFHETVGPSFWERERLDENR